MKLSIFHPLSVLSLVVVASCRLTTAQDYSCQWTGRADETLLCDLSPLALDEFKARSQVKKQVDPLLQKVNGSTVEVDGDLISLEDNDLVPIDMFSEKKGIRYSVDWEDVVFPSFVFSSTKDSAVMITKDKRGKLMSATKRMRIATSQTPSILEVALVEEDVFATFKEDDFDDDAFAELTIESVDPATRQRRHLRNRAITTKPSSNNNNNNSNANITTRSLQNGCQRYSVIDVDIVADSHFCDMYGGSTNAAARITSIVAEASNFYEDFCVKLELANVELFCNAKTDPIRIFISSSGTKDLCNSEKSFLDNFQRWVAASNTLNSDLVHLFHGHDFVDTSSIGCAFDSTLCNTWGYNTGVNAMRFSGSLLAQAKLFAHEAGHNNGARHVSSTEDLMYPTLSPYANSFGSSSRKSILNLIDSVSCVNRQVGIQTAPQPNNNNKPKPSPPNNNNNNNNNNGGCSDDPKFVVNVAGGGRKGCNWLAQIIKSTQNRWLCKQSVFMKNCPRTCGGC